MSLELLDKLKIQLVQRGRKKLENNIAALDLVTKNLFGFRF
jgi:hypothetical protein